MPSLSLVLVGELFVIEKRTAAALRISRTTVVWAQSERSPNVLLALLGYVKCTGVTIGAAIVLWLGRAA